MIVVADTWIHLRHLGAPQGYVLAGNPDWLDMEVCARISQICWPRWWDVKGGRPRENFLGWFRRLSEFEVRQKSIFDWLLKGWYVNTNKIFSVLLVTPLASWMESRTLARETRCRLRWRGSWESPRFCKKVRISCDFCWGWRSTLRVRLIRRSWQ